jgi:hypothetical protein
MVTYWGTENSYQLIYCFATEVVAEQHRILYISLLNLVYGLGMIIDAVVFFYVKEWTTIYIYVFSLPILLVFLGALFFIEKTPIHLLVSERDD